MKFYGVFLVIIGAISYGLPASLIKLANSEESHTRNVIFYTFLFSTCFLQILSFLVVSKEKIAAIGKNNYLKLVLLGGPIGLSNFCYYSSLKFIPVHTSAVLMMQSVWMATTINSLARRKMPSFIQILSIVLIFTGTIMVTGIPSISHNMSATGILWGLLSGFFYSLTILSTGHVAIDTPPLTKAAMMTLGAFVIIGILSSYNLKFPLSSTEIKWGIFIAIFSLIIPVCCFVYGMPTISSATGSIISSLELPAAVVFAWILIDERINNTQILGIVTIITAVILSTFYSKEHCV